MSNAGGSAEEGLLRDVQRTRARLATLGLETEVRKLDGPLRDARARRDRALANRMAGEGSRAVAAVRDRHAEARRVTAAYQQRAADRRAATAAIIRRQRKNVEALAMINSITLLKPSAETEKNELAELLEARTYEAGAALIVEGEVDSPGELIFVSKGSIDVKVLGERVAQLEAPLYVGEGRLITGEPASATVVAQGVVRAFVLSHTNFKMLTHSPNMMYMVPMMKREIEIRSFERATRNAQESLWYQLKDDAIFVAHVRAHAAEHHLELHVHFHEGVDLLRRCDADKDAHGLDVASKKLVRLVEQHQHILAANLAEKTAMLRLIDQARAKPPRGGTTAAALRNNNNNSNQAAAAAAASTPTVAASKASIYDALVAGSERVIVRTVIPSFKASGAYRSYLEVRFPLPTGGTTRDATASSSFGKVSSNALASSQA